MREINLTIYVEPKPKGRPKVSMAGKRPMIYTPAKTRKSEADIKATIKNELMKYGPFDVGIPLKLSAIFYIEKPKTARKRDIMPVKRPDLDNYGKLLLDAMNKYVYPDDSQITDLHLRKRFGSPPRIDLLIREEID